jgi:hypothetical protein
MGTPVHPDFHFAAQVVAAKNPRGDAAGAVGLGPDLQPARPVLEYAGGLRQALALEGGWKVRGIQLRFCASSSVSGMPE